MKTNDLEKGTRIVLRNGWYGTIKDNARGDIRICEVEGFETEIGSVYSHDIMYAIIPNENGEHPLVKIEHTPKQLKLRETVERLMI